MENEEKNLMASNRKTKIGRQFHGRYYSASLLNQCPAVLFDIENDDDIVCIGSGVRIASNVSMSDGEPSFSPKKVTVAADYGVGVEAESDEIEWITSPEVEQIPRKIANRSFNPNILNVENKVDHYNYPLQIEPHNKCNVIDVEQEHSLESERSSNSTRTRFLGCYDIEDGIENVYADSSFSPLKESCEIIVDAIAHADASPTPSVVKHDERVQESEIDEYDAKMRACFGLDFSLSSVDIVTGASELNSNTGDKSMNKEVMQCNCSDEEVICIDDGDSEDDCVVTDVESSACRSEIKRDSCFTDVGNDFENCNEVRKKIITETANEIFGRMMPLAVPGVLSLFAPDRNSLPQNVRPSKFCYYYFVSSHIVVKEIIKQEFYKFKEQILASKKSSGPPRCDCISHPLNQNASKLTLLTNPYSLYHKPNCHFAQNSKKNEIKRKKPRRLTYQVSFHRVPQRREGKDFKDWSDIVLRRRKNATCNSDSCSANWPCDVEEKPGLFQLQSSFLKSEPIDSNEMITIKTES